VTVATQALKRQRASEFPAVDGTAPTCGALSVQWESPFDRQCFILSRPDLSQKNPRLYAKVLAELIAGSGCTEKELLAHGNKVRAYLFFAEDRLAKKGLLEGLGSREKYAYQLPQVIPAF
jgi:hypothetical protein